MNLSALLGVVGTLGLVLGLMAVALRLLRRFAMGTAGRRGRLPMEVVQRLALGPKQGIAVVRVGERLLAVSLGEGGVRPLAELGDAERAMLALAPVVPPNGAPSPMTVPALAAMTAAASTQPMLDAVPAAPARRATLLTPLAGPATVPDRAGEADFRALLRGALRGGAAALLPLAAALTLLAPSSALAQPTPDAQAARRVAPAPAVAAPAPTVAGTMPQTPMPGVVGQRPADTRVAPAPRTVQAATPAQPGSAPTGTSEPPAAARVDTMLSRLAPSLDLRVGNEKAGGLRLSGTVGVVVMMGLMTLLPTLVLMMTGFTRILIVLHFLRQALGTQSAPPAHLVAGLALLLTGFVMTPTLREVNATALEPWMDGRIEQTAMLQEGVKPFRAFMLDQTRDADIRAFLEMSETPEPATIEEVPLVVLVSAFVTSELRTAFQIGFALFLPFIIIDVVVSSVLMSMGMFMLPPAMISLPFKLLLFVLVDGWTLLTQSLIQSFR